MSVFGQVWVFSAVAFVLGAFLAWLFLVRPARKRIDELQRRLASAENASRSQAGAQRTRVAPAVRVGDEDDDRPAVTPPTRRFEPAAEPQNDSRDVTEHLAPAPSWPESNSLQGREPTSKSEIDELDEDFARLDALDELQGSTGGVLDGPPVPDSEAPTRVHGSHGGQLDPGSVEGDGTGGGSRRGNSLFEPPSLDDEPEETPPAYAFGEGPAEEETEPQAERTTALPKRQPGRTQMESFEPAKPIQPSMRPVERRDPQPRQERTGSLFEPTVSPSSSAPPARDISATPGLPPGPFGPGSAMPKPGGGRPSEEFTVKASVTALRYCAEGSPEYPRMVAEVWFRTPADAERVGFRPLS